LLKKAIGCEDIEDDLSCMQAQSIEYIFENEDVMQGGIVWNAVPDYMFTTGLSMSLHNNFKLKI
jgi:hypothetical protein